MTKERSDLYMKAMTELLAARDRNLNDQRMANNSGQIVYILDTNICMAFLQTKQLMQTGRSGIRGLFSSSSADALDRLVARFLFEGHLPGQRGSVYLMPPHWNETLFQMRKMVAEGAKVSARKHGIGNDVIERLRTLSRQPKKLWETAERENFVNFLLELAKFTSFEARIKTLLSDNEDGIARLSTMDKSEFWTTSVDQLRWEDFLFWQAKLAAERGVELTSTSGEYTDATAHKLIENDAIALASIQGLYREHANAMGTDADLKFVFITADTSIQKVVTKYVARLQKEDIPNFVRAPSDYMPFVNYAYMHDRISAVHPHETDSKQLMYLIEEAILRAQPFAGERRTRLKKDQLAISFKAARSQWNDLAKTMVMLGTRYFTDDNSTLDDEQRSRVAQLFEEEDVVAAALNSLKDTITFVRDEHTRQISALAIERLLPILDQKVRSLPGRLSDRRAPLRFIGVDVMRPLKTSPAIIPHRIMLLDEFLELLDKTEKEDAKTIAANVIGRLRESWLETKKAPATYLFASGVYFSVGAWDSARLCAELGEKSLKGSGLRKKVWRRETNYAQALSLRMAMKSRDQYRTANELLLENMSDNSGGIARYRDQIERSALILTATVLQGIDQETPYPVFEDAEAMISFMPEDKAMDSFDKALEDAVSAADKLESDFVTQQYHKIADKLISQARANALGGEIFRYLIPTLSDERTNISVIKKRRDSLLESIEDQSLKLRFTTQLYLTSVDFLEDPSQAGYDRICNFVAGLRRSQRDLSEPDKIEQDFLCRVLADKYGFVQKAVV